MAFISIPTEQTTAVTDGILAIIALVAAIYLKRIGTRKPWKTSVWVWAFSLLSFASLLGAIAHGFTMSDEVNRLLWHPLYLALGLAVSLIVVGSVYDTWDAVTARRILPIMVAAGVGFFAVTLLWSDSFIVFVLYETAALSFALSGYFRLYWKRRTGGELRMGLGILITLIAAGIQATGNIHINLIRQFDHNGVFHLLQMVGIIFLVAGLRRDMLATVGK